MVLGIGIGKDLLFLQDQHLKSTSTVHSSERFLHTTIVTVVFYNFGCSENSSIKSTQLNFHNPVRWFRPKQAQAWETQHIFKNIEFLNWPCFCFLTDDWCVMPADRWTVLMACITASAKEDRIARCVELLLSRNADPNMVDRWGAKGFIEVSAL